MESSLEVAAEEVVGRRPVCALHELLRLASLAEALEHDVLVARRGAQTGLAVDVDERDARRDREVRNRHLLRRLLHEIAPDRHGGAPAGLFLAERLLLVEPNPRPRDAL